MKAEKNGRITPPPEKAERLYDAVRSLLEEGRNINTLTVSEITEKAGIGKGTAYEYFKSKEEMIVKAILYGKNRDIDGIEKRMDALPTFREKYLEILSWIEEIYSGKGSAVIFRHIAEESMQLSDAMKKEIAKYGCNPEFVFEAVKKFVHEWDEKEVLTSQLPEEFQCCMVMSSFAAFWMYLNRNPRAERTEREKVKDYLYRCLVSNLAEEKL